MFHETAHLLCSTTNEYTVHAFFVDTDQESLDFTSTRCRFTIRDPEEIRGEISVQVGYRGYTDGEFDVLRSIAPRLIHSWPLLEDDERSETVWMVCPYYNHSPVRGSWFINWFLES